MQACKIVRAPSARLGTATHVLSAVYIALIIAVPVVMIRGHLQARRLSASFA